MLCVLLLVGGMNPLIRLRASMGLGRCVSLMVVCEWDEILMDYRSQIFWIVYVSC